MEPVEHVAPRPGGPAGVLGGRVRRALRADRTGQAEPAPRGEHRATSARGRARGHRQQAAQPDQVAEEARQHDQRAPTAPRPASPSARPGGLAGPGPLAQLRQGPGALPGQQGHPDGGGGQRQQEWSSRRRSGSPRARTRGPRRGPQAPTGCAPVVPRPLPLRRPPAGTAAARLSGRAGPPALAGSFGYGTADPARQPVGQPVAEAPRRDPYQCLCNDRAAHLAPAELALGESDRHLDHPGAVPPGPPGPVDLEAVALAGHLVEGQPVEQLAAARPGSRRSRRSAAAAAPTGCRRCPRARAASGAPASRAPARRACSASRAPGRRRRGRPAAGAAPPGACDPSASISTRTSKPCARPHRKPAT